ncbi:MAG: DUF1569 domain-containing protein [Flavipsychrobacter sp.]|nr:DUF1569 domain-containing protein [Flavipsychrobacter sp.]
MVRIDNIEETIATLNKLSADTTPLWGGMTPQHMVEHLTMTIQASSGKMNIEQRSTPEEAAVAKQALIYTDMQIKQGVKSPLMGDTLPAYVNANLQDALNELKTELHHFADYYAANPSATHIQPRLGALKHDEWIIFHGKHFTHHFKQFGLI